MSLCFLFQENFLMEFVLSGLRSKKLFSELSLFISLCSQWCQEDVDMPHIVALPSSHYSIVQVGQDVSY